MPWQEVSVIDARLRFVRDVQRGVFSVAELCRRHRISRPVAYKWLARFEAAGTPGLADHSRRPLSCPHATDRELVAALCELRRHRPHWGAKKLRSEEHTSELQSHLNLVCRLLLEKKKKKK